MEKSNAKDANTNFCGTRTFEREPHPRPIPSCSFVLCSSCCNLSTITLSDSPLFPRRTQSQEGKVQRAENGCWTVRVSLRKQAVGFLDTQWGHGRGTQMTNCIRTEMSVCGRLDSVTQLRNSTLTFFMCAQTASWIVAVQIPAQLAVLWQLQVNVAKFGKGLWKGFKAIVVPEIGKYIFLCRSTLDCVLGAKLAQNLNWI